MGENDWFTRKLRSSKFMPFSIKKIKSYCGTKHLTKDQVKKIQKNKKRSMDWWYKSVYIFEDLGCNLIRYNNLGIIKAHEFRKNLGITNIQSIQRERNIKAIVMREFAKENMVRQYKIYGLSFEVDLNFLVHKLIIEVD